MPPKKNDPPRKPRARRSLPQDFKPGNTAAGFGNQNAKRRPDIRRERKAFSNEIDRQLQKAYEGKNGKRLGKTVEVIVKKLIAIAAEGDDKDAVKAITTLIDRVEGKPNQAVELSMNPDRPFEMVHRSATPAEAARRYQAMLRSER